MASSLRLAGIELYFDDLEGAASFYQNILSLSVSRQEAGHFAQFETGPAFICLEKKGSENYSSQDKAVLFLETQNLEAEIERIGRDRILRSEPARDGRPAWAVLHDPEGHNILLIERG